MVSFDKLSQALTKAQAFCSDNTMDALNLLHDTRLVPVVVFNNADDATPLASALLNAGINCIEVTLRTPCALQAIANISREVPDIILGAGSVITPQQFAEAQDTGAQFVVSPGATPELLACATLPFIPGCASASESMALYTAGYTLQKFFPAEQNGGVKTLMAWSGPLANVRYCPTGGINPQNALEYLALANVQCVGGSWFVGSDDVEAGRFEAIKQAAELVSP